jgi:hypothetical protein
MPEIGPILAQVGRKCQSISASSRSPAFLLWQDSWDYHTTVSPRFEGPALRLSGTAGARFWTGTLFLCPPEEKPTSSTCTLTWTLTWSCTCAWSVVAVVRRIGSCGKIHGTTTRRRVRGSKGPALRLCGTAGARFRPELFSFARLRKNRPRARGQLSVAKRQGPGENR